jgi:hypothetical protein
MSYLQLFTTPNVYNYLQLFTTGFQGFRRISKEFEGFLRISKDLQQFTTIYNNLQQFTTFLKSSTVRPPASLGVLLHIAYCLLPIAYCLLLPIIAYIHIVCPLSINLAC